MLAAPVHKTKSRAVRGNVPGLVGVIAKNPSSKPADFLTLENRAKADALAEAQAIVEDARVKDIRSNWENTTNKNIERNTIKRRVNDILQQNQFSLEDRREKLKAQLLAEQQAYIKEMESTAETPIERQLKMRERAKALRQQREQERLEFVASKEDQRWRDNCEELRTLLSKRSAMGLNNEREKQLEVKQQRERQNQADNEYFAQLWKSDIDRKAERETQDAQAKYERDKDMLNVLREQMAASGKAKEEEDRIKQEEYDLLVQEGKLRAYEDEQARLHKLKKQEETRNMYAQSIRMRMRKAAKDEQEEIALDMKILESLLEETKNEAAEEYNKKKRLREEYQRYRDYLASLKAEEAIRERELEGLLEEEQNKAWKKRQEQWKKEKEARKKLMAEVVADRRKQIEKRRAEIEQEKLDAIVERDNTMKAIAAQQQLEAEEKEAVRRKALDFQQQLNGQIEFRNRLAALENGEEYRTQLRQYEAEADYQVKLRTALERPPDRLHPMWKQYQAAYSASAANRA